MSPAARRLALRLIALAVLLALYPEIDWGPLRRGVRAVTCRALSAMGHTVGADSGTTFDVDGQALLHVTPGCTYARLMLAAAPFVWRFRRRLASNALRLGSFAALLSTINLVRLILAAHFAALGHPWRLVHDAPDLVLHAAVFTATILPALREDVRPSPSSTWTDEAGAAPLQVVGREIDSRPQP
ncbi:MAG TPA: hypothetical protein VGE98_06540 [Thermoanaerobaculia bacterium]